MATYGSSVVAFVALPHEARFFRAMGKALMDVADGADGEGADIARLRDVLHAVPVWAILQRKQASLAFAVGPKRVRPYRT